MDQETLEAIGERDIAIAEMGKTISNLKARVERLEAYSNRMV